MKRMAAVRLNGWTTCQLLNFPFILIPFKRSIRVDIQRTPPLFRARIWSIVLSLLRDADCENVRVCPPKLLAVFPAPFCILCNSLKHVVFGAVPLREYASAFVVLEAKACCGTVAMRGFLRFLAAVAKHLLGVDIVVAMSNGRWWSCGAWRMLMWDTFRNSR